MISQTGEDRLLRLHATVRRLGAWLAAFLLCQGAVADIEKMQAMLPAATVVLQIRELEWLVDPQAPHLIQHVLVVSQTVGAVQLRREYQAPDA